MVNFMDSIGTMMKGSGLEEAFGIVYGTNTTHMISGKYFSKALRGHLLVEATLTSKFINQTSARSHKYY